jgi:hypothetical protein
LSRLFLVLSNLALDNKVPIGSFSLQSWSPDFFNIFIYELSLYIYWVCDSIVVFCFKILSFNALQNYLYYGMVVGSFISVTILILSLINFIYNLDLYLKKLMDIIINFNINMGTSFNFIPKF